MSSSVQNTMAPVPGGANAPPQFFVDSRRTEVNELRTLLRSVQSDKDINKKRDALKKVIAYMTLGVDVSRLFPEIVLACHTNDLVQKKMIYFYLCNYAEHQKEMTILVINTLQKDAKDEDPTIRGLALRSLSSLRVPNIIEYLEPLVRAGIKDNNGYVRKTAVMCIAKMYKLSKESIESSEYYDLLKQMIMTDHDNTVVANSIVVLNEILSASAGGITIDRSMAISLLNKIKHFNEFIQATILQLLSSFTPASEDELFDVLNILEDRLRHSNSAIILSTVLCFLNLTRTKKNLYEQAMQRITTPLLTLMTNPCHELVYTILSHILLLLDNEMACKHFSHDYVLFYCKYNDPSYIKVLKVKVLNKIINERNANDIINEVSEYIQDSVNEVSVQAIHILCSIGKNMKEYSTQILDIFLGIFHVKSINVASISLISTIEIVLTHRDLFSHVLDAVLSIFEDLISNNTNSILTSEAVASLFDFIGSFGMEIESSPYLIEAFIKNMTSHYEEYMNLINDSVLHALLSCVTRLFSLRTPESLPALQKLFYFILNEEHSNTEISPDVKDRTLFFYRLLLADPAFASRLFGTQVGMEMSKGRNVSLLNSLGAEFNTLSVIYRQTATQFITTEDPVFFCGRWSGSAMNMEEFTAPVEKTDFQSEAPRSAEPSRENERTLIDDQFGSVQKQVVSQPKKDLLFDDEEEKVVQPETVALVLSGKFVMAPATFQKEWLSLKGVVKSKQTFANIDITLKAMEKKFSHYNIYVLASGITNSVHKLFCYCLNSATNTTFYMEVLSYINLMQVEYTIKYDPSLPVNQVLANQLEKQIIAAIQSPVE